MLRRGVVDVNGEGEVSVKCLGVALLLGVW